MNRDEVTAAGAIQPPAPMPEGEEVSLLFLRDTDGNPVRVWVAPMPELELMDLLASLPAAAPRGDSDSVGLAAVWETFKPYAVGIIERCCTPRFSFADETPDGCVPGAWLRDSERMALVVTALRVSGWMGGAAQQAARWFRSGAGGGAGSEPAEGADGAGTGEPMPTVETAERVVPSPDGD